MIETREIIRNVIWTRSRTVEDFIIQSFSQSVLRDDSILRVVWKGTRVWKNPSGCSSTLDTPPPSRPPKMRSALKGTRAQHFCHYRVIFTGGRGLLSVKDGGRMCARQLNREVTAPWFCHRFSIAPPAPYLKRIFSFIIHATIFSQGTGIISFRTQLDISDAISCKKVNLA